MGLPSRKRGRLLRCANGTKDAGALWEDTYAEVLVSLGFARGKASPCCFFHAGQRVAIVVHGGNFIMLGHRTNLAWCRDRFAEHVDLCDQSSLGTEYADSEQSRILTGIVTVAPTGLRYEAERAMLNISRPSSSSKRSNSTRYLASSGGPCFWRRD